MLQFNATFIVAIVSFVIFIVIMNMLFYKPVLNIIEKREKFIRDNIEDANKSNEKVNSILQNKENRINEAYKSAKKIINDNNISANKAANEVINNAKINSNNKIQDEKEKILNLEKSTDVTDTVNELSDTIVNKLVGEWI